MKKILFLALIVLVIGTTVSAQKITIRSSPGPLYHVPYTPVDQKLIQEHAICEITTTHLKGSKSLKEAINSVIFTYNHDGRVTKTASYKKGKADGGIEYTYNEYGNVTGILNFDSKMKPISTFKYEYNTYNLSTRFENYKKNKPVPDYLVITQYDSNKLTRSDSYRKGKLENYSVYSYFPNGSTEQYQLYNAKGKLLHTSSYVCIPEPQNSTTLRDTIVICRISERDSSGNLLEITEYNSENKKRKRYIAYYTPDTLFFESRVYNYNDILTQKLVFIPHKRNYSTVWDKLLISHHYTDEGKPRSSSYNSLDHDNRIKETKSYRWKKQGKVLTGSKSYLYNDKGLLLKREISFKNRNMTIDQYEYKYRVE